MRRIEGLTRKEQSDMYYLMQHELKENARSSLLGFTKYTFPGYQVNWHHKFICDRLDKAVEDLSWGKSTKIVMSMPPRSGKSELVSRRFPAYLFGKNPDLRMISATYGASLSSDMNRDVQKIIMRTGYSELFPETSLSSSGVVASGTYLRNSEVFQIVNHNGHYKCSGVGGALTGKGGSILLLDDPIRGDADANSKTIRDKTWKWFTSDFYSRWEPPGIVIVCATRWHEDDPTGRLLTQKNEGWELITFPALAENQDIASHVDPRTMPDESLWPDKYPTDYYEMIRQRDPQVFQCLYQGRPTKEEGNLFKKEYLSMTYDEPPEQFDHMIQSWDLSFGSKSDTASYVVGQVWGKLGSRFFLLHQVRGRFDMYDTMVQINKMRQKYPQVKEIVIEDKANGPAVISVLKRDISGVVAYSPGSNSKPTRAKAIMHHFRAGDVFIPSQKPWIDAYRQEMLSFDRGAYDDQVDCTVQAIAYLAAINDNETETASIWDFFND